MRQTINGGRVSYEPNSLGGGCPMQAKENVGGFVSYTEKMDGQKVRARSEKFFDHFSQAALFWNSQSDPEKNHLVQALRFELGKVEVAEIRARMVAMLAQVDGTLAGRVAKGLGLEVNQKLQTPLNMSIPADGNVKEFQPKPVKKNVANSPALSMANTVKDSIKTRKVAILGADGFDDAAVAAMKKALTEAGAQAKLVAPRLGLLKSSKGAEAKVDFSLLTASSVMFDAVYVPGGEKSVKALQEQVEALEFVQEAFKHCKTIAANGAGLEFIRACRLTNGADGKAKDSAVEEGVILGRDDQAGKIASEFIKAIAQHRHWSREKKLHSPA